MSDGQFQQLAARIETILKNAFFDNEDHTTIEDALCAFKNNPMVLSADDYDQIKGPLNDVDRTLSRTNQKRKFTKLTELTTVFSKIKAAHLEGSTTNKEPASVRHKAAATVSGVEAGGDITSQANGGDNAEATVQNAKAKGNVLAEANQGETVAGVKDAKAAKEKEMELDKLQPKILKKLNARKAEAEKIKKFVDAEVEKKETANKRTATCVLVFASLTTFFTGLFAAVNFALPVDGNTTYQNFNDQTLHEQIGFVSSLAGNVISLVFALITTLLKNSEQNDKDEEEKVQRESKDVISLKAAVESCILQLELAYGTGTVVDKEKRIEKATATLGGHLELIAKYENLTTLDEPRDRGSFQIEMESLQ